MNKEQIHCPKCDGTEFMMLGEAITYEKQVGVLSLKTDGIRMHGTGFVCWECKHKFNTQEAIYKKLEEV